MLLSLEFEATEKYKTNPHRYATVKDMLTKNIKRRIAPYLLLLPTFGLFGLVLVVPWANSLFISFQSYSYEKPYEIGRFVGLDNYERLFTDALFLKALRNSLVFFILSVSIGVVLGLIIAVFLFQQHKGRRPLLSIVIMPMMIAPFIAGMMWKLVLQPDIGVVNYLLNLLGFGGLRWLSDPSLSMVVALVIQLWSSVPFAVLVFTAGLYAIPPQQYEAATIDGSSSWQIFIYITLPWLRPLIMLVLVFTTMWSFKTFETIFMALGPSGGPYNAAMLLSNYLHYQLFKFWSFGLGSALSWIMLAITAVISTLIITLTYRREL